MSAVSWNPWHGCHKFSEGCKNCYVYYFDQLRGRDANSVVKSKSAFKLPLQKDRSGNYKIPSGEEVNVCFTSDFFIEEADEWRNEAWQIIRERKDLFFQIPTKRVERIKESLPADWKSGYDNVAIAISVENQTQADTRVPIFLSIPIRHKEIFICPILEYVNVRAFIRAQKFDLVSVGGESYDGARTCDFEWVKRIKEDCDESETRFIFHQTGSKLLVNGVLYNIPREKEYSQARKAMELLKKQ